jgi:hypothetical protein
VGEGRTTPESRASAVRSVAAMPPRASHGFGRGSAKREARRRGISTEEEQEERDKMCARSDASMSDQWTEIGQRERLAVIMSGKEAGCKSPNDKIGVQINQTP